MENTKVNNGYGVYTVNELCLFHDYRELYSLMQNCGPFCDVFSAPTLHEAAIITHQRYPRLFWTNPFNWGFCPMMVKQSGEFALRRKDRILFQNSTAATPKAMTAEASTVSLLASASSDAVSAVPTAGMNTSYANQGISYNDGIWSITFAQGMAITSNINEVVNYLASPKCYLTHAQKWPTLQAASWNTWKEYANRFYQRNDATAFHLEVPQDDFFRDGAFFYDKNYEARESAREDNSELDRLKSFGIC